MASCQTIPTLTLYGSSTSEVPTVTTTFSTETTTLPDRTSTFVSTSCQPIVPPGLSSVFTGTACSDVLLTSFSVIPGATSTITQAVRITTTVDSVVTFPTQTLYSTSCDSTSEGLSQTPTDSSSSSSPSPSQTTTPPETPTTTTSLTTPISSSGFNTTSYSLSTPSPSTYLAPTSFTSDGSVISSDVLATSFFPASTIYNAPGTGRTSVGRRSNAGLIGGVVGGAIGLCIALGVLICLWRRKRRRDIGEISEFEKDSSGRFGRRLELDLDDEDLPNRAPYHYGLVGHTGRPDRPDKSYADDQHDVPRLPPMPFSTPLSNPAPRNENTSSNPTRRVSSSPSIISSPSQPLIALSSDRNQSPVQHRTIPSSSSSFDQLTGARNDIADGPGMSDDIRFRRQSSRSSLTASLIPPLKVTNSTEDDLQ